MALPVKDQIRYWGIATAAFLVILWFLGDVILPFVLGGAIAYFLDPIADRLERHGRLRAVATTIITLGALLIFVLMALLVIPTLVQQAVSLFDTAPQAVPGPARLSDRAVSLARGSRRRLCASR